jgi:hypothetical protein
LSSNGGIDDSRIRAWLLNDLDPEQASEIERRLAEDPDLREIVESIEEELFDDYARGRLTRADAAGFRGKYLATPEGSARAEFARAFAGRYTQPSRSVVLRAAAAILIAVASFQVGRMSYEPIVGIDLRPGIVRSNGAGKSFDIPARATIIEFRLYPDQIAGDHAAILTTDEKEIASGPAFSLPDGGRRVTVPAASLEPGTYIIRLDAADQTVGTFVIRLRKK